MEIFTATRSTETYDSKQKSEKDDDETMIRIGRDAKKREGLYSRREREREERNLIAGCARRIILARHADEVRSYDRYAIEPLLRLSLRALSR